MTQNIPTGANPVVLPPFRAWLASNIPAVYDNTMSYYDELTSLIKYLESVVLPAVNKNSQSVTELAQLYKELKEFVDHYFDNLDVQEEINNKLDNMVQDGTFATLLEQSVGSKSTYIGFTRLMRELIANTNNPDYGVNDYPQMQGGCYITNNVFVQCSLKPTDNTNAQLRVINLGTGSVERTAILPLLHANSVSYNPTTNKLYICSLVQDNTNQHYLYVVDYATLTLSETIEFSTLAEGEGVHSISYDTVTGKTVLCTEQRGTNDLKFYDLDLTDNSLTQITLENYHNLIVNGSAHKWSNNDICVHNNILYLLKHSPNAIVTFNLGTGKCIYVYNCQQFLRYGVNTGEFESISVNPSTGDFYLSCTTLECLNGWFNIFNYVMTNFQHGVECNELNIGIGDSEVYVDASSTSIDPTGTSAKPFKTIGEALQRLNSPAQKDLTIYLREGEYPYVSLINNKDVRIRPVETTHPEDYIVDGIYAKGGRFFTTAITINGTGDYDIELNRSEATITACVVDSNKTNNINMYNSTLHAYNIKDENSHFAKIRTASESTLDCHESEPEYILTNQIPTLTKAIKITNYSNVKNTLVNQNYTGKEDMLENDNVNLYLWLSSQAGYVKVPFKGSTVDKSSYCSGVSGGNMCRFVIAQDVSNKTIGIRTQTVIALTTTTPSDVTSTTTFAGSLWIETNN